MYVDFWLIRFAVITKNKMKSSFKVEIFELKNKQNTQKNYDGSHLCAGNHSEINGACHAILFVAI